MGLILERVEGGLAGRDSLREPVPLQGVYSASRDNDHEEIASPHSYGWGGHLFLHDIQGVREIGRGIKVGVEKRDGEEEENEGNKENDCN